MISEERLRAIIDGTDYGPDYADEMARELLAARAALAERGDDDDLASAKWLVETIPQPTLDNVLWCRRVFSNGHYRTQRQIRALVECLGLDNPKERQPPNEL